MKKIKLFTLSIICCCFINFINAQSCLDVVCNAYEENGTPACIFTGYASHECTQNQNYAWTFEWIISDAVTGTLIASYNGAAFAHTFEKFGTYDFCLKTYNEFGVLISTECETYTTCQICDGEVDFVYNNCDNGGCDLDLLATFDAQNIIGITNPQFVITYHQPYWLEVCNAPNYPPTEQVVPAVVSSTTLSGTAIANASISVLPQRGCYHIKFIFDIVDGGVNCENLFSPCTSGELVDDQYFRCQACGENCEWSMNYAQPANEPCYSLFCVPPVPVECPPSGLIAPPGSDELVVETQMPNITISPNPATNYFEINIPSENADLEYTAILFDSKGQLILQEKIGIGEYSKRLSTTNLSTGSYFLMLKNNGNRVHFEKIFVQQ